MVWPKIDEWFGIQLRSQCDIVIVDITDTVNSGGLAFARLAPTRGNLRKKTSHFFLGPVLGRLIQPICGSACSPVLLALNLYIVCAGFTRWSPSPKRCFFVPQKVSRWKIYEMQCDRILFHIFFQHFEGAFLFLRQVAFEMEGLAYLDLEKSGRYQAL